MAKTRGYFLPLHHARSRPCRPPAGGAGLRAALNLKTLRDMKTINLSLSDSVVSLYLAELRDAGYQQNRLLFRNNIERVGMMEAYEISKTLAYESRDVATPLGTARSRVPADGVVLATIFRAGLPFHQGFLNVFDHAACAFVSAYREYTNKEHTEVGIHVEYLATPSIEGKTLIIADPMLATGLSMEMAYRALPHQGRAAPHPRGLRARHARRHRARAPHAARGQDHRLVRCHRPGAQRAQVHRAGAWRCRRPVLRRQGVTRRAAFVKLFRRSRRAAQPPGCQRVAQAVALRPETARIETPNGLFHTSEQAVWRCRPPRRACRAWLCKLLLRHGRAGRPACGRPR